MSWGPSRQNSYSPVCFLFLLSVERDNKKDFDLLKAFASAEFSTSMHTDASVDSK